MSYLHSVSTTQEIEIKVNLLELANNHVESLNDLKQLLEGISSHLVDAYLNEVRGKVKNEIYGKINCAEELKEFIDSINVSIENDYKQQLISDDANNQTVDLIDLACSVKEDELQDLLICILNQHPRGLHRFMVSKQVEVKLAMIESAQALLADLGDFF